MKKALAMGLALLLAVGAGSVALADASFVMGAPKEIQDIALAGGESQILGFTQHAEAVLGSRQKVEVLLEWMGKSWAPSGVMAPSGGAMDAEAFYNTEIFALMESMFRAQGLTGKSLSDALAMFRETFPDLVEQGQKHLGLGKLETLREIYTSGKELEKNNWQPPAQP